MEKKNVMLHKTFLLFLIIFGLNCSTFNQTSNNSALNTNIFVANETKVDDTNQLNNTQNQTKTAKE